MSKFDAFRTSLRESIDHLADGWQDLWGQARNALTRFTPFASEDEGENHPMTIDGSRWGVISAELKETPEELEVQIELPGMDRNELDVRVEGHHLVISGKKHYKSDRKEGRFLISERAYGHFQRALALPCQVDVGSATYADGVLTVNLPKIEKDNVKRIKVN
jgi:HSP20 family protein